MPRHPHDPASGLVALASGTDGVGMDASRTDLLSQLLALLRLRGELIYSVDLTAPWALAFPPGGAHFHFVVEGVLHVRPFGEPLIEAGAGELLLLPLGNGHELIDSVGTSAVAIAPRSSAAFDPVALSLEHGGGGAPTRIVSGTFHFDGHTSPIVLDVLPTLIRISRDDGGNAEWLEALVHFLLAEAHLPRQGSAIMISRLIDVLVVQTLRSWAAASPDGGRGWLGGIGDHRIERALSAMHADPLRDWGVAELAGIAAMSRSTFSEQFALRIGEPPLRYLTNWRLTLATDMLATGTLKVGEVARRVGYDSDAAFSRAYKSRFGHPPTESRPDRVRAGTEIAGATPR